MENVLRKLPSGFFIRFDHMYDMNGSRRKVIVWCWMDEYDNTRTSAFCSKTGEYLGEC